MICFFFSSFNYSFTHLNSRFIQSPYNLRIHATFILEKKKKKHQSLNLYKYCHSTVYFLSKRASNYLLTMWLVLKNYQSAHFEQERRKNEVDDLVSNWIFDFQMSVQIKFCAFVLFAFLIFETEYFAIGWWTLFALSWTCLNRFWARFGRHFTVRWAWRFLRFRRLFCENKRKMEN